MIGHGVLAFGVFPGAGFAADLAAFKGWAGVIATYGPSGFYEHDASANYPPVSIYVLWGVEALSRAMSGWIGRPDGALLVVLLKLPAVVADALTAMVVWRLTRRLSGPSAGLVAALAFLLLPPVWYVSAIWGQLDSLLGLFSILALWLVVTGRAHLAALAAVGAVMVKPQGVIVLIVVGVVLVASLAGRDSDGRRQLRRLASVLGATVVAGLVLLVPFDYEHLAPAGVARVPVVGDLVGFWHQSTQTAALFPVLSANAANVWALVGTPTLAASLSTGTAVWHLDALTVLGVPAWLVGVGVLAVVVAVVVRGLTLRRDAVAVLLGYVLLSSAFFVVPTRVHERYLVPAFAAAAVLAAPHVVRLVVLLLAGLLNVANLHAVLAAPLDVQVVRAAVPLPAPRDAGPPAASSLGPPPVGEPQNVLLPWAGVARAEWVVQVVSLGQTAMFLGLLVVWIVVVRRRADQPVAPGEAAPVS